MVFPVIDLVGYFFAQAQAAIKGGRLDVNVLVEKRTRRIVSLDKFMS